MSFFYLDMTKSLIDKLDLQNLKIEFTINEVERTERIDIWFKACEKYTGDIIIYNGHNEQANRNNQEIIKKISDEVYKINYYK